MGGELAGHRTKCFFHQSLSRTADFGRIGVEGVSPILPSPGALPDDPLCRGLLSGRMELDITFSGDDQRQIDRVDFAAHALFNHGAYTA